VSADILIKTRAALLDALDALQAHRDSLVVIGAQAVYLRTSSGSVALAETTKDSDLVVDPRELNDDPLLETALTDAGFAYDLQANQPGAWLSPTGIPVDLMIPEQVAGGPGRRGGRIPPHSKQATRRARGLEAAVVDNSLMDIKSLDPTDQRNYNARVAGPAALLVAKAHKIGERLETKPSRLDDKDAHDAYRIFVDVSTEELAAAFAMLREHEVSATATSEAVDYLRNLFAAGPDAPGSMRAGRAEEGIGEPATVALQTSILADDLIKAL